MSLPDPTQHHREQFPEFPGHLFVLKATSSPVMRDVREFCPHTTFEHRIGRHAARVRRGLAGQAHGSQKTLTVATKEAGGISKRQPLPSLSASNDTQ